MTCTGAWLKRLGSERLSFGSRLAGDCQVPGVGLPVPLTLARSLPCCFKRYWTGEKLERELVVGDA